MLAECVGKGGTALHAFLDLVEYQLEVLVLLLTGKDFKALDQRQPRIDHGCELAGENDHVLGFDLTPAELGKLEGNRLGLFIDGDIGESVLFQLGFNDVGTCRLDNALLQSTGSGPRFP